MLDSKDSHFLFESVHNFSPEFLPLLTRINRHKRNFRKGTIVGKPESQTTDNFVVSQCDDGLVESVEKQPRDVVFWHFGQFL